MQDTSKDNDTLRMVGLATEVIDISSDRLEKPRYYSIQDVMACLIFHSTTNNSRSYRIVLLADSCVYFYIFSPFNLPILIVLVMMQFEDIINSCFSSYGIITSCDSLFCIRYKISSSFFPLQIQKSTIVHLPHFLLSIFISVRL